MAHGLTTTSYAILGLLALKPWTTYELAQQMGRALGQFWPRAESKLYEEPKKLVALGLATADRESVGKRRRTVYSITDDGRQALSRWLPLAGAPPVLEFELLIKVFFAEHGTKDDLLATIGLVRAWTEAQATLGVHITGEYLEGRGPYPERLPWILLTGQFLQDFLNMVELWADRAAATVETWPDDIRTATPDVGVLEAMAADNRAILERADQRRRASPPAAEP